MARNRRPRSQRRRRTRARPRARNNTAAIDRISKYTPVQVRMPLDPPSLLRLLDLYLRIPINIRYVPDVATTKIHPGTRLLPASLFVQIIKGIPQGFNLSYSELTPCIKILGIDGFDLAVKKIQFWGSNEKTDSTILLIVDVGLDSGRTTVIDTGTPTRRPRLSLSVPVENWHTSDDTFQFMSASSDTTEAIGDKPRWDIHVPHLLGVLHITVHVRSTNNGS